MGAAKTIPQKIYKYYRNYILVLAILIPTAIMGFSGSVKGSLSSLLIQMSYSAILAVSLNLVVGFLGELSLGHAGFMCVGAYVGGYVGKKLIESGNSHLVALIVGMAVGGVCAAVSGFLIGLPTLRLKGDYLAIVTLAFGEIVRNLFMNMPSEIFGGALGMTTTKYGKNLYIIGFVMLLITLTVCQNFMRSKHGRAVTAIRDNEIAASAMGVNVTYYKMIVFVVAAFFAGIAGVIYSFSTTPVSYSVFSFNYSIEILVMVVLGGMGNITGSLVASLLLTWVNVSLTTSLSGDLAAFKYLIYALILIFMVMWNNAPAMRHIREKLNLRNGIDWVKEKVLRKKSEVPEGGNDSPETAVWDKIPTKIHVDAVLSTDLKVDHNFEADRPEDRK